MNNAKVKTTRDCSDHFGDHGGYFDVAIRPMLQQGHEGELCGWLKEMSLIRTVSNCPHTNCKGKSLVWHPARIVDKYNWTCPHCTKKQSIREKSFFLGIKCDLKLCLQLIFGWCQQISYEDAASYLDIKTHVVKKVYERCDEVSETYVMSHPEDWMLGDKSAIVIVDEFPGGCMVRNYVDTSSNRKRNNNSHTIVCIVEANTLPPRMWLHMIEAIPEPIKMDNIKKDVGRCNMVKEALKEITSHTLPGSCIIANSKARCCSYESLLELKQYKVISVEQLQKFDPPGKFKLLDNLETIWRTGVEICEEIQETTHTLGQHIISRYFAIEIEIMNNKNKSLKPTALLNAIKKKIQQLYGDYGLAAASIGLLTKYYNSSTKIAFVRTRHGPHRFILNALPLITDIDHQTVKVNIIYIGATIKHCFLNVRRYHQKKLEEVWGSLKTDYQRKEMLRVLNSTISVKDFNRQ